MLEFCASPGKDSSSPPAVAARQGCRVCSSSHSIATCSRGRSDSAVMMRQVLLRGATACRFAITSCSFAITSCSLVPSSPKQRHTVPAHSTAQHSTVQHSTGCCCRCVCFLHRTAPCSRACYAWHLSVADADDGVLAGERLLHVGLDGRLHEGQRRLVHLLLRRPVQAQHERPHLCVAAIG